MHMWINWHQSDVQRDQHSRYTDILSGDLQSFFSPPPSGLCLEKVPAASPSLSNKNTGSPSSNRSTTTDREQDIITCYEKSGDIALLYLQEAEKVCACVCVRERERVREGVKLTYSTCLIAVFCLCVAQVLTKYLVSAWTPKCDAIVVGVWWTLCWRCAVWLMHYQPWQPTGKHSSSSLFGDHLVGLARWAAKQQ